MHRGHLGLFQNISAGILTEPGPDNSIYRLAGRSIAIWDGLQWFVSITGLILLYRYHIDMCLWYALRVSKGTLNPKKTNKSARVRKLKGSLALILFTLWLYTYQMVLGKFL